MSSLPRLLCVDDEPHVLATLQRILRNHFDITTADRPDRALGMVHTEPPFAVVLSDLRMPLMDGIELLRRVHLSAPDTSRVLLTGHADLQAAVAAVNRGQLHRFLLKPCPRDELVTALDAAVELNRRRIAECDVLDETLRASVATLLEVLAVANPGVFARTTRITAHVRRLVQQVGGPRAWEIEVAAMLSQLGALELPVHVQDKLHRGMPLTHDEQRLVTRIPDRSAELIGDVPRLDLVRDIIRYQLRGFDGTGHPDDGTAGTDIPLGARMLKLATDYDTLLAQGLKPHLAMSNLQRHADQYDPDLLAVLTPPTDQSIAAEIPVDQLPNGATLAADVRDPDGLLLVGAGQQVSSIIAARLTALAADNQAPPKVWVKI